ITTPELKVTAEPDMSRAGWALSLLVVVAPGLAVISTWPVLRWTLKVAVTSEAGVDPPPPPEPEPPLPPEPVLEEPVPPPPQPERVKAKQATVPAKIVDLVPVISIPTHKCDLNLIVVQHTPGVRKRTARYKRAL